MGSRVVLLLDITPGAVVTADAVDVSVETDVDTEISYDLEVEVDEPIVDAEVDV